MRALSLAAILGLALASTACRGPAGPEPVGVGVAPAASGSPKTATAASPSLDLVAVARRIHFGYRPAAGGYAAEHATYAVRATARGAFSLTPRAFQGGGVVARNGAPLTLETVAIARTGWRADTDNEVRVAADGSLQIGRSEVLERLRNTELGVEQTWTFATRPPGAGPLEVRVRTTGLAYEQTTVGGVHFASAADAPGVRYGHATWIDGRGVHTGVPARWADGEIHLVVPRDVVLSSTYPAVLDPTVSAEVDIDDVPVYVGVYGWRPRAASNGSDYLVVWDDSRSGTGRGIYGARVTAAGEVLDKAGIRITDATGDQTRADVAWNGSSYLVVWQDFRSGTYLDVYGARVDSSGSVLDPDGLAISTATYDQTAPRVACRTGECLVVWADGRIGTATELYGAQVDAAGTVLAPAGKRVTTDDILGDVAVAAGPDVYLVGWRTGSPARVFGARVDSSGDPIDTTPLLLSSSTFASCGSVGMSWNGSAFFVVTEAGSSFFSGEVKGQFVDPDGTLGAAVAIAQQTLDFNLWSEVTWNGSSHFVVWNDRPSGITDRSFGIRVSPTGTVLDPSPVALLDGWYPAVAANGADFLALINGGYGRRVSGSGSLVDANGFLIAKSGNAQDRPAAAFDGTNYLVIWEDNRNGSSDLYAARVTPAGDVLDADPLPISAASGDQRRPHVVWNGSTFLVVWEDHRAGVDVYGTVVTPAGQAQGPEIAVYTGTGDQTRPQVAWNGTDYLVVWEDHRSTSVGDVYGARVTAEGAVLSPAAGIRIVGSARLPTVAWASDHYLIAWEDYRTGTYGPAHIYGARMDLWGNLASGTVLISGTTGAQLTPRAASDGTNFLVTWIDGGEVRGARVSPAGVVLDVPELAIGPSSGGQSEPTVAFDGHDFLVAWTHSGSATGGDIIAGRVAPGGTVLDPTGFVVSELPVLEHGPSVASDGAGSALVAYGRFDPDPTYGSFRVRARLVGAGATLGSPCANDSECASGYCVDGVCCNTACGGSEGSDCQACSVSAGAQADGMCVTLGAGTTCRPAAGSCDVAEHCDGAQTSCPPDAMALPAVVCRPAAGVCDVPESCTGWSVECPPDTVVPGGLVCREASDVCDQSEACSGTAPECPADHAAPDHTPCPGGTCISGMCVALQDGGTPDATPSDGGLPPDAADGDDGPVAADAGADAGESATDGAGSDAETQPSTGGCGCRTMPAPGGGMAVLLLIGTTVAGLVWRRGRSRRRASRRATT